LDLLDVPGTRRIRAGDRQLARNSNAAGAQLEPGTRPVLKRTRLRMA